VSDRKEGLGTLLLLPRGRKLVAEYMAGEPRCGSVLALEDGDLEPLCGGLAELALQHKLEAASSGAGLDGCACACG
jgi:hypothetical protein